MWRGASVWFFAYVVVAALVVPGLAGRRRGLAIAGAAAALAVLAAGPLPSILEDWLLPPALLLAGYWTSGLLFAAPMARVERLLVALDRRLGVTRIAAAAPPWLADLLEVAYAGVYAAIPIALVIYLRWTPGARAADFWSVILITDYVCFAFLPWVRTRPPRALDDSHPWVSRCRPFNLRLLGTASIQVNTFPSGHAAEGLAAALFVSAAPWPVPVSMGLAAAAISAGAVLGRYHYAADALAGWVVAAVVWWLLV
jgi:hypothetical protein